MDLEEECMASAQMTEGGLTKATFNPGGDNEQELETEGFLTDNVSKRGLKVSSVCDLSPFENNQYVSETRHCTYAVCSFFVAA